MGFGFVMIHTMISSSSVELPVEVVAMYGLCTSVMEKL